MPIFGLFGPPDVKKLEAHGDISGLIKALSYQKDLYVRIAAAEALSRRKDKRAVEPFIAALNDPHKTVRNLAVNALRELKDIRAVEALIAALSDSELEVREDVVYALGELGDARAVPPLIAVMTTPGRIAERTSRALGKIGDPRAVEPLILALSDRNHEIRSSAASALGQIGDSRAVPALIQALNDPDFRVQIQAVRALGELKDPAAIGPLTGILEKSYPALKEAVQDARRKCGYAPDIEPLLANLHSPDWTERLAVVEELGSTQDVRAVQPLIAALGDPDFRVCEAATIAIKKIDPDTAGQAIHRLCKRSHVFGAWRGFSQWEWDQHSELLGAGKRICVRCGYVETCINHVYGAWEDAGTVDWEQRRECKVCGHQEFRKVG